MAIALVATGMFALTSEQVAAVNSHTVAGTLLFLLGMALLLPSVIIEARNKLVKFAGQE